MQTEQTVILLGGSKLFTNSELVDKELPKILKKRKLKTENIVIYGFEDSSKKAGAYNVAERWAAKNNVKFLNGNPKSGESFEKLLAERNLEMSKKVNLFINLRHGNSSGGQKLVDALTLAKVPIEVIVDGSEPKKETLSANEESNAVSEADFSPAKSRKGVVPDVEKVKRNVNIYSKVAQKLLDYGCLMLDTETTGLADDDEVIELAIADCKTGVTVFNSLINTEKESSPMAFKVNKITKEMLKDKPNLGEVWPTIEAVVGNRVMLASNSPFDERLLNQSLAKFGLTCSFIWKDIQTLYRNYSCQTKASDYPLKTLGMCKQLGVQAGTHRAKDDVEAQIRLLRAMAEGVIPNFEV